MNILLVLSLCAVASLATSLATKDETPEQRLQRLESNVNELETQMEELLMKLDLGK